MRIGPSKRPVRWKQGPQMRNGLLIGLMRMQDHCMCKSDQASSVAGQARQGLAMVKSVSQMQSSLSNTVSQVTERQEVKETGTGTVAQAPQVESPPVVNTSGQITGVVVNTTA